MSARQRMMVQATATLICAIPTFAASSSNATIDARTTLIEAVSCLEKKNNLAPPTDIGLTIGYAVDTTSYPGETVMYVLDYSSPQDRGGLIFAIFVATHQGRLQFNIQNNASFVVSGLEDGVSFVDPPLGGTWTQEHLMAAIRQIEKQTRITVSATELHTDTAAFSCTSYTDPQT